MDATDEKKIIGFNCWGVPLQGYNQYLVVSVTCDCGELAKKNNMTYYTCPSCDKKYIYQNHEFQILNN
ncbi:hypothetical protein [Enterococcus faecium]|uniref:hypothetical protein n=1 Tax=Enterococcus faecium TaxID=1352 RepID=UPI000BF11380|nr:hypothetical protein [Enterococcus faecium]PEH49512.1 hypothetical protein CRM75_01765 [Enterococcus faecium]